MSGGWKGEVDRWVGRWMERQKDKWMFVREGWTDGRVMDGWTDG